MKLKTALLAIAALVSGACTQEYVTLGGYAQGGIYSVKYNPAGVKVSRAEAQQAVDGILEQIDTTLSGYNRKSLLSRRNAGEKVELNDMFREIEEISEHYRELSGGAFDVAAGPLFDVWGFGFTADSLPSDEAISAAINKACAAYVKFELSRRTA